MGKYHQRGYKRRSQHKTSADVEEIQRKLRTKEFTEMIQQYECSYTRKTAKQRRRQSMLPPKVIHSHENCRAPAYQVKNNIGQKYLTTVPKVTPRRACAEDAQADLASDCLKVTQEYFVYCKKLLGNMAENLPADSVQSR